jgi:hypothetical protein
MAAGGRISRSIDEFDKYIGKTSSYLSAGTPTTNAERLGVLPAEVTQWQAFETEWNPLHLKYNDKTNSRTVAIRNNLLSIIDRTVNFDQTNHILDRIAASPNVTIDDLGIFNINGGVLPKTTRSVPTTPINEPVTVTIQPIGGGSVTIKCYSSTGQRAAIYDNADCVQYLYQVGDTAPTSADSEGLSKDLSTKASFTLALGSSSSAKNLYIYFRWFNTKHPELAGPWSSLQTTLIL